MALPPWTVELLRRGVQDLARQATDPETTAAIKQQAAKLVEELPRVARERVDTILKQAESTAQPLKDAWAQSDLFAGLNSLASAPDEMPRRLVNGSGVLMHPLGSGVPYSSAVQAAAIPFLSGDASIVSTMGERLNSEIALRFGNDSGEATEYAACIAPSFSDALTSLGTLGRRGGRLFVPRCDAWRVLTPNDEETLAEILQRNSHSGVREFGQVQPDGHVDLSEINRALKARALEASGPRERPHSAESRAMVLVRLAAGELAASELPETVLKAVLIPAGTFHPSTTDDALANLPSIQGELANGADVVVLAGGVLCGTPPVGIMVGRSGVMSRLRSSRSWQTPSASAAETAMVAAAIDDHSQDRSPMNQLLAVSEENLRDRAERLATQISGASMAQSVRVTNEPAYLSLPSANLPCPASQPIPSRQVVVKTERCDELADRMLSGKVGILTTKIGDDLAIDMRWMSPDQQSTVAGYFR